jgi:hypothetical protein
MASEARPSNGADSRDPLDRHASLAMTELELFTRKRYNSLRVRDQDSGAHAAAIEIYSPADLFDIE